MNAKLAGMREDAAAGVEDGGFASPGGWMDVCGSPVCVGSARVGELVGAVLDAAGVPALLDSARELHRRHGVPDRGACLDCGESWPCSARAFCLSCEGGWPCPTARLVYTEGELAVFDRDFERG